MSRKINKEVLVILQRIYNQSHRRILFLDYDGTLVPLAERPEDAVPDENALETIRNLSSDPKNKVVIISGRERKFLEHSFRRIKLTLVAEHGFYTREEGGSWQKAANADFSWKSQVIELMKQIQQDFPGSLTEEKETSVAWHYRTCKVPPTADQMKELRHRLLKTVDKTRIRLLEGHKVIEVKNRQFTKGTAAWTLLQKARYDFILAIGDDMTDENLFYSLPDKAITIRIGTKFTHATYYMENQEEVISFFSELINPQF